MAKRIGILTGGGDVPGLNSVIKSVVYGGSDYGFEVVGIRKGWEGLSKLNLDDPKSVATYVLPLNRENTRTIDRTGGTFLHSSRTNPAQTRTVPAFLNPSDFPSREVTKKGETYTVYDLTAHALKLLDKLGIEYLIAIGGDDTLSYAERLHQEGVKVIAVPKTMDNDVRNTEYCIGFSTAISRSTSAINRQRSTVGSHERIGVFRVFGRDAGYTALYTAYVTDLRCGIPEYRFDLDRMIELLLRDKERNPSNYSMLILSEGAAWEGYVVKEYGEPDAYGHRKKMSVGEAFSEELKKRCKEETVISDLTYDLRGGEPDFVDKMVATTFGNMALDALAAGKSGFMTAIVKGCFTLSEIPDPKLGPRKVDVEEAYCTRRYRPKYTGKLGLPIFLTRA
jgi:6-phosphofructokinase 1